MEGDVITPKRRVLHCITHFSLGGAERVAFTLIDSMSENYDFAVFAVSQTEHDAFGGSAYRKLNQAGIPVVEGSAASFKWGGCLFAARSLQAFIRDFKPDLIHLHTEIPELTFSIVRRISAIAKEIPVVRTIHNAEYWQWWSRLGCMVEHQLKKSAIIAISSDAKEEYLRHRQSAGIRSEPESLDLIYNGVPIKSRQRSYNGLGVGKPIRVIFAGRFEEQKGADLIPAIFRNIALLGEREILLDIYGKGKFESDLASFACNPPANVSVRLKGVCANLPEILPSYDCLIMPSRFEGLGLVAVEAILSGVVVITTKSSGLNVALPPDYPWKANVSDANDFSVVFNDALNRIPEWNRILSEAQSHCAAKFSVEAMVSAHRSIYSRQIKELNEDES